MALLIAHRVADGQIGLVAVAAFAQGLDVFKRGVHHVHMLTTHPARHLAVQLAGDGVVDFLADVGWFAHVFDVLLTVRAAAVCPSALLRVPRVLHGQSALGPSKLTSRSPPKPVPYAVPFGQFRHRFNPDQFDTLRIKIT